MPKYFASVFLSILFLVMWFSQVTYIDHRKSKLCRESPIFPSWRPKLLIRLMSISDQSQRIQYFIRGIEWNGEWGCSLSATVCKIGFILAESGMSRWFVPAGIAVGVCCSGSGFFCQVRQPPLSHPHPSKCNSLHFFLFPLPSSCWFDSS